MIRKVFILLVVCLFSTTVVCAQTYDSYNMRKAFEAMEENDSETAYNYVEKEIKENPSNAYAWVLRAIFKQSFGDYESALEDINYAIKYTRKGDIDNKDLCYAIKGECYYYLYDYESALKCTNKVSEDTPRLSKNLLISANCLYELGKTNEAISRLGDYIKFEPSDFYGYYRRGFFKDNVRDVFGAIEDYTIAIALDPEYAYSYLGRADMYAQIGQDSLSRRDYEKVIELDIIPSNNSCAQYAYLELGHKEEAAYFMEKVIESDSNDAGNYYDAACLYSLMGESKKAIEYLKIAFEKGFKRFSHIDNDDDLDNIRMLPEFIEIYNIYKNK